MHSLWVKLSRTALFLVSSVALAVLAGCSSTQTFLQPNSPSAQDTANLFYLLFVIAALIFILVEGLLVVFVLRYQRRAQNEHPEQIHGNTPLEITWTLIPALILAGVFALTIRTMASSSPKLAPTAEGMQINVIGHQWWWEIQYPDQKVVTASELHIPTGKVVNVKLTSDNVIHSFWVPQLMGKTDTVPGHTNASWLYTETPGLYHGQCAEFCGEQHAHMLFRVLAQPQAEFDAWIQSQQVAPTPVAAGSPQARGQEIFLTPAKGCIGCHTVEGTTAKGIVGPNLTHFASRDCFAGCMVEHTTENLSRWLHNPQAVKPGTLMKIPPLTDEEVNSLIAYLESLK